MKANLIRAEAAAEALLEKFGIEKPEDLILEDVAYLLGIKVYRSYLESAEAYLLRLDGHGIIRVNSKANPGRQQFSFAHELGHWELRVSLTLLWLPSLI